MVKLWVLIFSLLLPVFGYAQTSGGGPFTHGQTLSVTDGISTCYPYQLTVTSGTLSCSSGIATVTTGGGGGGSPASPFNSVQYNNAGAFGGNDGFVFVAPNVGIGTTTPVNKLQVVGGGIESDSYYYNDGSLFANSAEIDAPTTGIKVIDGGTIWYPDIETPLADNSGILYYGNGGTLADINGTYYNDGVPGDRSTDQGGNLLFSHGYGILADDQGTTYFGGNNGSPATNALGQTFYGDINMDMFTDENGQIFFSSGYGLLADNQGQIYFGGGNGFVAMDPGGNFHVDQGSLIDTSESTGNTGDVWHSNGSGLNYWGPTSAVGADNNVQYAEGGALAGSNNFNFDGSNVGIGTTDLTQYALTVIGGVAAGGFYLDSNGSAGIIPNALTNTDIQFFTAGVRRVAITHAGNVGIGTTSPTGALEIEGGNVGIGTNIPSQKLVVNGNLYVQGSSNGILLGDTSQEIFPVSNGDMTFQTGTPTRRMTITAQGNIGIATVRPNALFEVGVGKFDVTAAGNVGVGSPNPSQAIDINGSVRMSGFILTTSPSSGYVLTSNSTGTGTWAAATGGSGTVTSASVVSANGFAGTVATSTTTPAITLTTTVTANVLKGNGTAIVAATSGTDYAPATSGSSILKGNGAGGFSNASSGTDYAPATSGTSILKGNGSGGFSNATSGTDYDPATSGSGILFGNGAGGTTGATTTAVSGGNIGIGTTTALNSPLEVYGNVGIQTSNPGQRLDIQGTARMTGFILSTSPSSGYVLTSDTGGNGTWTVAPGNNVGVGTTQSVGFYTSSTVIGANNKFIFNGTNVGIGTSSANKQLAVGSTGQFTVDSSGVVNGTTSIFTSASSGTPAVVVQGASTGIGMTVNVNGAGSNALQLSSGDIMLQETVGTRSLFIGNVGIGSVNPGAALDLGTSGQILSHNTSGIGFSEHNATNQACNTTCGTSACVIGLDIGTVGVVNSGFVACTSALADDCICAGP